MNNRYHNHRVLVRDYTGPDARPLLRKRDAINIIKGRRPNNGSVVQYNTYMDAQPVLPFVGTGDRGLTPASSTTGPQSCHSLGKAPDRVSGYAFGREDSAFVGDLYAVAVSAGDSWEKQEILDVVLIKAMEIEIHINQNALCNGTPNI